MKDKKFLILLALGVVISFSLIIMYIVNGGESNNGNNTDNDNSDDRGQENFNGFDYSFIEDTTYQLVIDKSADNVAYIYAKLPSGTEYLAYSISLYKKSESNSAVTFVNNEKFGTKLSNELSGNKLTVAYSNLVPGEEYSNSSNTTELVDVLLGRLEFTGKFDDVIGVVSLNESEILFNEHTYKFNF